MRWGLGDVFAALLGAYAAVVLLQPVVLALTGQSGVADSSRWPLSTNALGQVPLYGVMLGAALLVPRRKGRGPVADLRLGAQRSDVLTGLAVGAVMQLAAAVMYVPLYWLTSLDPADVDKPARELAAKANGAGVLLLILVVVLAAPIVEEIFYRGFLLRALERRAGSGWAVLGSGAIFAASHFELLQFPALLLFGLAAGWLAVRYGRLGPSIAAHLAFNATAVYFLLK